jgi:hypothetical protein
MASAVWCVQHRDGWCMTSRQARPPREGAGLIRTKCGCFVVLPWGLEKRRPDCKNCLTRPNKRKGEAT